MADGIFQEQDNNWVEEWRRGWQLTRFRIKLPLDDVDEVTKVDIFRNKHLGKSHTMDIFVFESQVILGLNHKWFCVWHLITIFLFILDSKWTRVFQKDTEVRV